MKHLLPLLALSLRAWGVTDPTLPAVYIDTTFPTFAGATIAVHMGDDLQAAIDSAACGDKLVLDAGVRWVGNYMLPHRASCTTYTGIVSSGLASLPVGTRVGLADLSHMATISTATVAPVIDDADNANYWWIAGMHITTENAATLAGGVNQQLGLLFGYQHNGNETPSNSATHIILDRVVVDGNSTCECKRGMMWNGAYQAIIDSYVEVHSTIFENQAIGGVRGTGPYKIVNNELRGSGENILFGGGDPSDRTTVAADFEIKRNLIYKPSAWQAAGYLVKNLLELKSAKRLLIDGNIFDGSWTSGQDGIAISFKSANQNDGVGCPQCTTQDVTFTNNIVRNANMGFVFYGQEIGGDSVDHTPPEAPVLAARIKISNVLLSLKALPGTYLFAFGANDQGHKLGFHSPSDVQINHVTAVGYTNIMVTPEVTGANVLVRNSVLERGGAGFGHSGNEGSNCYSGSQCVLGYWLTPYTFNHMLILNNAGTDPTELAAWYSAVAPLFAVGYGNFVNYANHATDYHNLALTAKSAGHLAASDGKDLGVDFAALDAAISGTVGTCPTCSISAQIMINSGGPSVDGYIADQFSTGSKIWDSSTPGYEDLGKGVWRDLLYAPAFSYSIPVSIGTYTVTFLLMEPNKTGPGQRKFTISVNGGTGAASTPSLDLFQIAGVKKQYQTVLGVFVATGTLRIDFRATVGNAVVSAINIWPVSPKSGLFTDQETPIGTIDGINRVFTLLNAPDPSQSLSLYRNGLFQTVCMTIEQGEAGQCGYFLLNNTITFIEGAQPSMGEILTASYRR